MKKVIKPKDFLSIISAPAKRALENENISTLEQLSTYSEKELLQLHGVGKTTIPKLISALESVNLSFKKEN